jgi:hypothetical protein
VVVGVMSSPEVRCEGCGETFLFWMHVPAYLRILRSSLCGVMGAGYRDTWLCDDCSQGGWCGTGTLVVGAGHCICTYAVHRPLVDRFNNNEPWA